jgi:DNA-binding NtrC family response regulator
MPAILFIETDPKIDHVFNDYFSKETIQVITVKTVDAAKKHIENNFFDLLVIDITEGLSGDQSILFVKELRKQGIWIPCCFYTSRSKDDVFTQMEGYNCLDLIPKDILPDEMVRKVKDMLYLTSEQGQKQLSEVADLANEIQKQMNSLLIQLNSCCSSSVIH